MHFITRICILLGFIVSAVWAEHLKVLVQPIEGDTSSTTLRGVITYDPEDLKDVQYEPNTNASPINGKACVGIEVSGKFNCMALSNFNDLSSDKIVVHLNRDNSVNKLDYSRNPVSGHNEASVIKGASKGPIPALKEPVRLVDNDVPKEEPPKSFLQKYWIYIVPPLIMLMVSGGGGAEGAGGQ